MTEAKPFNRSKICFILAACAAVLSIVLTILILTVDVRPIGPEESEVGLAGLNAAIAAHLFYNRTAHNITEWLGYAAVAVIVAYFCLGAYQLIRRRSVLKVDRHIFILGGFYALLLAVYLFFEFVPVNYRPMILDIDKGLESSFPSSHTMLAVCVFLTLPMQPEIKRIKNRRVFTAVCAVCVAFAAETVVLRFVAGVHWATDIIGGLLISAALIFLYRGFYDKLILKN